MPAKARPVLVFDSGLGGLTVYREIAALQLGRRIVYAADDAAFPYGRFTPEALVSRVNQVMDTLAARHDPELIVIACNTASTLVLPHLRSRYSIPVVGTVPGIKPAAEQTRSGLISVLATPGTVRRDYTHDLILEFAADKILTLVGAEKLAGLAEAELRGEPAADADILSEIAPCFVERSGWRTDVIVLGCTHYPLLLERMKGLAPWPVAWIDPAPAIARRAAGLLGAGNSGRNSALADSVSFTSGLQAPPALADALERFGLRQAEAQAIPHGW